MRLALAAAVLMLAAPPAGAASSRLDVQPRAAGVGATVTVTGKNLTRARPTVGGKRASVVSASAKRLTMVIPLVRAGRQRVRAGRATGTLRVVGRFDGRIGVRLAASRRRAATIGPAGGRIVTSNRRVTYTLTVPPGALAGPTRISVTPLARITDLPLTGGHRSGVQFAPAGLSFAKPATLAIRLRKRSSKPLVGFSTDHAGRAFALARPGGTRSKATLAVPHFSDFGISAASEADLALTLSFVVYGEAPLTRDQVRQLISARQVWEQMFPGFCGRQLALCGMILERAQTALARLIDEACRAGLADPSMRYVRELGSLGGDVEILGGEPSEPAGTCIEDLISLIVGEAIAAAERAEDPLDPAEVEDTLTPQEIIDADIGGTPGVNHVEWLWFLWNSAERLGANAAAAGARTAALAALERTRTLGLERCDVDERAGEAYLRSALNLSIRVRYRQTEFAAAIDECHVHVTVSPAEITLAPGETQQFTATVTGGAGTSVTWSADSGTIYEQAIYTAPQVPGTYTVTATSVANTRRKGTAIVHVGCSQPVRRLADTCEIAPVELQERRSVIGAEASATGSDTDIVFAEHMTFDPFSQSVTAEATGPQASGTGTASQASEIVLDAGQMTVRAAGSFSGSASVAEDGNSADGGANSDFRVEFEITGDDVPYVVSGSVTDPVGAVGQAVARLTEDQVNLVYTHSDTGSAVSGSGTLGPGTYNFRVDTGLDVDPGESATGSYDLTLTVG